MTLAPLETLYDAEADPRSSLPLPSELEALYGQLRFPPVGDRPYLISNFVTTLDGVVSLSRPGQAGGGPISGFNPHDRMVMALLRSCVDVVVVGAGTLRASPGHVWTADHVDPDRAAAYQDLRHRLHTPEPPLNVIVTAGGDLDLSLPVFQSGAVSVLIVTTADGARHLREKSRPPVVQVTAIDTPGRLSARAILQAINDARPARLILSEAGPQLMGDFLAEQCLDELFLTVAPQIAGRESSEVTRHSRPGLVAGQVFAPDQPRWSRLVSLKRGGSHLFMRYQFESTAGR